MKPLLTFPIILAFAAALVAAFLLAAPAGAAHAAPACMPTAKVRELLAKRYGERPAVLGVTSAGRVMIVYLNPVKRTWSIVVYTRTGLGCLIETGGDLRFRRAPKPKPKGNPS